MPKEEFLTAKELSRYINVKQKTLYQWVGRGILPHYRIQGLIRFKKSDIDEWLAQNRQH